MLIYQKQISQEASTICAYFTSFSERSLCNLIAFLMPCHCQWPLWLYPPPQICPLHHHIPASDPQFQHLKQSYHMKVPFHHEELLNPARYSSRPEIAEFKLLDIKHASVKTKMAKEREEKQSLSFGMKLQTYIHQKQSHARREKEHKRIRKLYRSISSWCISRLKTIVLGINLEVEILTRNPCHIKLPRFSINDITFIMELQSQKH